VQGKKAERVCRDQTYDQFKYFGPEVKRRKKRPCGARGPLNAQKEKRAKDSNRGRIRVTRQ